MSHPDQLEFLRRVRRHLSTAFSNIKVLEVGSLNINGSIREVFYDCDYTGIDVGPGPDVDIVVPGQSFAAPDSTFDTVVSAECMEHNPEWRATTRNMVRMLRPGGLFLSTCAAPGRAEHGTTNTKPWDSPLTVEQGQAYYRNLDFKDFERSAALDGLSPVAHWMNWSARDLYIVGIKGGHVSRVWRDSMREVDCWIAEVHQARHPPRIEQAALSVFGTATYERMRPTIRLPGRLVRRLERSLSSPRFRRST